MVFWNGYLGQKAQKKETTTVNRENNARSSKENESKSKEHRRTNAPWRARIAKKNEG